MRTTLTLDEDVPARLEREARREGKSFKETFGAADMPDARSAPIANNGSLDEWLPLPNVVTPSPGERHWEIVRELLADSQCRGQLVADAVLAALAMEYGAELCTNGRDFRRFTNLRVVNPLQ